MQGFTRFSNGEDLIFTMRFAGLFGIALVALPLMMVDGSLEGAYVEGASKTALPPSPKVSWFSPEPDESILMEDASVEEKGYPSVPSSSIQNMTN